MNENIDLEKIIAGQDKHYSDEKFLTKLKHFGGGLGYKAMHGAATLYYALKSPEMPKSNKLIIFGALGYFILPIDLVTDFLPLVGLADDTFVIIAALTKVYTSISDDMKDDAHHLLEKIYGKRASKEIKK